MNIRKFLALLAGKTILKLTRFLKIGGGSAAPGLYALKIYPELVSDLAQDIPRSVAITGTNGKTTTARMLAHFAQTQGLKVLRNATGSNLERGVASTLLSHSHLPGGKLKHVDLAIWELDEAILNHVVPKLKPQIIIFLNVFRDQLDRYGEVDTVVKHWSETLKKTPKSTLILLNGDDYNLLGLKKDFKGEVITFGVENYKIRGENIYKKVGSEKLDLEAKNLILVGLSGVHFELSEKDGLWIFTLPLPGIYHIYDFLAAYICAQRLGIEKKLIIKALQTFSPAFGRAEKIQLNTHQEGYILLIKNPMGATQVFETLKGEFKPEDRLLIVLNDNLADGTDVSWIWDVDFGVLQNPSLRELLEFEPRSRKPEDSSEPRTARVQSRDFHIIVSGTRAQDLAVRLKYAGFNPDNLIIENNLKKALEQAKNGLLGRLFILPTYTALLSLQKILAQEGIKEYYWKEAT